MISFVWSSKYPFWPGAGGSENYTAGQIHELQRRGIPCRVITIGHGENDGRDGFPGIEFVALRSKEELSALDDTLIFVTYPLSVQTKHQSYVILHLPPPTYTRPDPLFDKTGLKGKQLITSSKTAAKMWTRYLNTSVATIKVVYPFAEEPFGDVRRQPHTADKIKLLFSGRLNPDKGIYTLLAALHMPQLQDISYEITTTAASAQTEDGQIIQKLLEAHPKINLIPPRRNPASMAQLMAEHDVVVIPTTNIFWRETFGIVSVEAQHAGCRVVASRAGGLPETDCGGLILAEPDNPLDLAKVIAKAAEKGPLTEVERQRAIRKFTVSQSVDSLLQVIGRRLGLPKTTLPRTAGGLLSHLQPPQLRLFEDRWKR
jgi:glycosyltransferase involved in cell wall biosynthesis